MKFPHIHFGIVLFVMTCAGTLTRAQVTAPTAPATPPLAATDGPVINFDNNLYDFGKAWAGKPVKHIFVVTNTGTSLLEITNVKPSCGCTTTGGWSHEIEPGKTGTISIQFDDSHYSGNVTKTIDVFSNAKNQPRATLRLVGSVKKPLEVSPLQAIINIPADATNAASAKVHIVNETDSAVTISEPTSSNKEFSADLKVVRPGQEYDLIISVNPPVNTARNSSTISLKTTLESVPSLSVTAIAIVQNAIQVSPNAITLGPSTDHWTTNRISIHGIASAPLKLEDPQSTDSRLQVTIVPMGAPNLFNLLVAVPPGFEIPRGQHVRATVKSNYPRNPLLTIPILQVPRSRGVAGQYVVPPSAKQSSTTNAAAPPHP